MLELNNDLIIRLIGIADDKEKFKEAIDFLENKTRNQSVYMKYDDQKFDENNRLLCYLYLKNRTFLNAHLIKNELAFVDLHYNYKLKSKFIGLGRNNG